MQILNCQIRFINILFLFLFHFILSLKPFVCSENTTGTKRSRVNMTSIVSLLFLWRCPSSGESANLDHFLTERVLSVRPASQTSRSTFSLGAAGLAVGLSRLCPDILFFVTLLIWIREAAYQPRQLQSASYLLVHGNQHANQEKMKCQASVPVIKREMEYLQNCWRMIVENRMAVHLSSSHFFCNHVIKRQKLNKFAGTVYAR